MKNKEKSFTSILGVPRPAESYSPDEDEKQLASDIKDLFQTVKAARSGVAAQWEYNRLMLKGDQLLYKNDLSQDYVRVSGEEIRQNLYSVNNKLQPTARSLHGKLCRSQPMFTAIPSSVDQTEMYGANVADAIIKYFDSQHKMELIWSVMKFQDLYAGNSVIQLAWDPMDGRKLATCEQCNYITEDADMVGAECPDCLQQVQEAQQMMGEAAAVEATLGETPPEVQMPVEQAMAPPPVEIPVLVEVREGCEKPIAHKIEDIYPDHLCTDIRDARFMFVRHIIPLSTARSTFPEKGRFIGPDAAAKYDDYATYNLDTRIWSQTNNSDCVEVLEYHEIGSDEFPAGRIIFVANGIVLEEKEGYYDKCGRLLFFANHWWKYPTSLWAQSFIDSAVTRQKELNELETAIREYQELACRPKYMYAIGSVTPDELTSRSTQSVGFNRNFGKPEFMMPPSLPPSLYERKESLIQDIKEHAAVTAAETGAGSSETAGRALAILEAESDQQIEGMLKYNRAEMAEFYRCMLIIVKAMYRPDRKFTILGDMGPELYSFEDLKLKEGWSLVLEPDDGLSGNRSVRLSEVGNLISLGFFRDAATGLLDEHKAAKAGNLKIRGSSPDIKAPDEVNAYAAIKRIESGDFSIQPEVSDDPNAYSRTYLYWLKTKGKLPTTDPEVKSFIEQLYMYYVQQSMEALMAQGGIPGAPGAEGETGCTAVQSQSAAGGSPNSGGMGVQQGKAAEKTVASQAGRAIGAADAQGERAARSAAHEN